MSKGKIFRIVKILFFISLLLITVCGTLGILYYINYKAQNTIDEDVVVTLSSKYDYNRVLTKLEESGAFIHWKRFRRVAEREELEKGFKPGRYVINASSSNIEVVRMIRNGWQTPGNLMLSGRIRNKERLASVLSRDVDADSLDFINLLTDSIFIENLGFSKETFPAMFIPNTYQVYWTSSAKEIILRFKEEYDKFWNQERLAKAERLKMTPVEVSTMAAIVYEESNWVPEQPTIAGVYINRIRKGMRLQADPTVIFANNDPTIRRVLKRHTQIDSPYNTYKYKGLPPGPIAIPPISAIDAVLDYENHDYIYFCARPEMDGRHNFAATYNQHLKNASLYRKELNKRGIK